jgi:hypothetical protein
MEALDTGSVRDPAARLALRHLVTSSGTLSTPAQVKDEMAGVEEDTQRLHLIAQVKSIADKLVASAGALAVATGDDSLNRLPAWIKRHTAKLTTSTPIEDILAIADMVDELGAKFDRIKVDA